MPKDTTEKVKQVEKKIETKEKSTISKSENNTQQNGTLPIDNHAKFPGKNAKGLPNRNARFRGGLWDLKNRTTSICREENILRVSFTVQADGSILDTPLLVATNDAKVADCLGQLYKAIKSLEWIPAIKDGKYIEQEARLTLDGDSYHIDYFPDVTKQSER